jgi:predicted RNase H-like HicB family nuclease
MPTEMMKNDASKYNISRITDWSPSPAHRFHILLTKDDPDSFSAVVLNLPGAGSCGSTEEEAMENVKEAIRGVLEAYKASGQDIPWKDSAGADIPPGTKQKWIIQDA